MASDRELMEATQKSVGALCDRFAEYLKSTNNFMEVFGGVGLNSYEAAALCVVVPKIWPNNSVALIALGIWLANRDKP